MMQQLKKDLMWFSNEETPDINVTVGGSPQKCKHCSLALWTALTFY
jgi:hypothetical protein